MNLIEALWCNWHHVFAEDVNVVLGWNERGVNAALQEPIVHIAVASVDEDVVVVAEGQWAVHIEDNVTISAREEVTFRLLKVQKA